MAPVVTDPKRASLALKKIVVEMEKRYELFSKSGTRNIEGYNNLMKDNLPAVLPYIVVIVDELADLMMVATNDVEDAITRLAQMARARDPPDHRDARPSVDVITGVIKANIPSRIAFGVSSQVDSRTILDMAGAEKPLGRGDMLFMPMGSSKPIRVQGAFMSDHEVENIVDFVRDQGQAEYDESLVPEIEESAGADEEELDELYEQAVTIVLKLSKRPYRLAAENARRLYLRRVSSIRWRHVGLSDLMRKQTAGSADVHGAISTTAESNQLREPIPQLQTKEANNQTAGLIASFCWFTWCYSFCGICLPSVS